ncbi:V-type proton ATPasesubunit a [Dirofilaria immitis]
MLRSVRKLRDEIDRELERGEDRIVWRVRRGNELLNFRNLKLGFLKDAFVHALFHHNDFIIIAAKRLPSRRPFLFLSLIYFITNAGNLQFQKDNSRSICCEFKRNSSFENAEEDTDCSLPSLCNQPDSIILYTKD